MKILLHICCGICAAGVAEQLLSTGHSVTGMFYNPNIYPEQEYNKRLDVARDVASRMGFELIELPYDHEAWLETVKGYESQAEGGERCRICYRMRLEKTAEISKDIGFDMMTTTLTISPMKQADAINDIGNDIAGDDFMRADFKKKDGFKRTIAMAKEWGLYRQCYCGCEYSVPEDPGTKAEG